MIAHVDAAFKYNVTIHNLLFIRYKVMTASDFSVLN